MDNKRAIFLDENDNVANLTDTIHAGEIVTLNGPGQQGNTITAIEDIPFGFKIAIKDIPNGSNILKYGQPMGVASKDIPRGCLVHVHNIEGARGRGDRREQS